MATVLTYQIRQGVLSAAISGRRFRLRVHRDPFRIAAWQVWAAAETGKTIADTVSVGSVSHKLKVSGDGLEIYDYPGSNAKRGKVAANPSRRRPENHSHSGGVIFVREREAGFCIHGYPPCNIRRCIVVSEGWEELFEALGREPSVEIYIEF
jgi:hypothetical protein